MRNSLIYLIGVITLVMVLGLTHVTMAYTSWSPTITPTYATSIVSDLQASYTWSSAIGPTSSSPVYVYIPGNIYMGWYANGYYYTAVNFTVSLYNGGPLTGSATVYVSCPSPIGSGSTTVITNVGSTTATVTLTANVNGPITQPGQFLQCQVYTNLSTNNVTAVSVQLPVEITNYGIDYYSNAYHPAFTVQFYSPYFTFSGSTYEPSLSIVPFGGITMGSTVFLVQTGASGSDISTFTLPTPISAGQSYNLEFMILSLPDYSASVGYYYGLIPATPNSLPVMPLNYWSAGNSYVPLAFINFNSGATFYPIYLTSGNLTLLLNVKRTMVLGVYTNLTSNYYSLVTTPGIQIRNTYSGYVYNVPYIAMNLPNGETKFYMMAFVINSTLFSNNLPVPLLFMFDANVIGVNVNATPVVTVNGTKGVSTSKYGITVNGTFSGSAPFTGSITITTPLGTIVDKYYGGFNLLYAPNGITEISMGPLLWNGNGAFYPLTQVSPFSIQTYYEGRTFGWVYVGSYHYMYMVYNETYTVSGYQYVPGVTMSIGTIPNTNVAYTAGSPFLGAIAVTTGSGTGFLIGSTATSTSGFIGPELSWNVTGTPPNTPTLVFVVPLWIKLFNALNLQNQEPGYTIPFNATIGKQPGLNYSLVSLYAGGFLLNYGTTYNGWAVMIQSYGKTSSTSVSSSNPSMFFAGPSYFYTWLNTTSALAQWVSFITIFPTPGSVINSSRVIVYPNGTVVFGNGAVVPPGATTPSGYVTPPGFVTTPVYAPGRMINVTIVTLGPYYTITTPLSNFIVIALNDMPGVTATWNGQLASVTVSANGYSLPMSPLPSTSTSTSGPVTMKYGVPFSQLVYYYDGFLTFYSYNTGKLTVSYYGVNASVTQVYNTMNIPGALTTMSGVGPTDPGIQLALPLQPASAISITNVTVSPSVVNATAGSSVSITVTVVLSSAVGSATAFQGTVTLNGTQVATFTITVPAGSSSASTTITFTAPSKPGKYIGTVSIAGASGQFTLNVSPSASLVGVVVLIIVLVIFAVGYLIYRRRSGEVIIRL